MRETTVFLLSLLATAKAFYSSSDDVIELTDVNFNQEVIQSDDLWLVEFYAPWCKHCETLAPEWKKTATSLKGVVKVGAVDVTVYESVADAYNISGYPTVKVFGIKKNSPHDYQGSDKAAGIVNAALAYLDSMVRQRQGGKKSEDTSSDGGGSEQGNSEDVIELNDYNFQELVLDSEDMWMVEFYAPWCNHCKLLASHWATAAAEMKGKIKFGVYDFTLYKQFANQYDVKRVPTMKLFPSVNSRDDVVEYEGERTSAEIVLWLKEKLAENVPPPEIYEIVDHASLNAHCEDRQLCIVAVLPHILDCQSECRNKYLQIMKDMGEKYKRNIWGWLWAEAGAQPALEDGVGVGGFGYPTMVAISPRKMMYSTLMGPFSETGIDDFFRSIATRKVSSAPLKGAQFPKLETIEAWDGRDREVPADEDLDLSDVVLDDLKDDLKYDLKDEF